MAIMSNTIVIGNNEFEVITKVCNGRSRQYLRCMHIENGTNRRCTYERRADSSTFKKSKGYHLHTYDIQSYFISKNRPSKEKQDMNRKFLEFIAKSNISIRKCVSETSVDFFNSCILYGYSIGKSQSEITESDLWDFTNRTSLRDEIIQRSQEHCRTELNNFRTGITHLSIDSSTINRKSLVDIILICNFHNRPVKTLIYDNHELKSSNLTEYKRIALNTIAKLYAENIKVMSIVSDGFSSQRAAFDIKKTSSFQNEMLIGNNFRSIQYVYCRCHLLNLALKDLITKSHTIAQCHSALIEISNKLRKNEIRKKLGYQCPEPISTRFCYDYLIIKFIACHLDKIESQEMIQIDKAIFVYGVLVERLWFLIGEFESRDSTLSNTYGKILKFYDALKRIEEKALYKNTCLNLNARLFRNLVQSRLYQQHSLVLIAFSLTKDGRNFFRSVVGYEENVEERQHEIGIIEDFFFNSVVPSENEIFENSSEESNSYDIDISEETEEFEAIMYEEEELMEVIEKIEEKNMQKESKYARKGIINIAKSFFEDYARRAGYREDKINRIINQYNHWMSLDNLNKYEHMLKDSIHNFWYLMRFSQEWSELAEIAQVIVTIPASEVENERMFSIKRNIIGKYHTRISPELLNARARLASVQ